MQLTHKFNLLHKFGLALTLLTGIALSPAPAQAQTANLTLGQSGSTTLTGTATLTNTGTTVSGTYSYANGGSTPLGSQNSYTFLATYGPSTATVNGGTIDGIFTTGTSTVTVKGGSIGSLKTADTTTIDLFGTGLVETFAASYPQYRYTVYNVTGTLQNGNSLNDNYLDYGGTLEFNGTPAVPVYPVPETSSVVSLGLLLLLGISGITVSRRRKVGN